MINKDKLIQINYILDRAIPITNRRGVYIGIDRPTKDIVYIGQANDYWKRASVSLKEEIKKKQTDICKNYNCDEILFIPCKSNEEMNELEKNLILFYCPYYNSQLNKYFYKNEPIRKLKQIFRNFHNRNLFGYEIQFILEVIRNPYGNHYNIAKRLLEDYSSIEKYHQINKKASELKIFLHSQWDLIKGIERSEDEKIEQKKILEETNNNMKSIYKENSSTLLGGIPSPFKLKTLEEKRRNLRNPITNKYILNQYKNI